MANPQGPLTLIRYWSSFIKSARHGRRVASYFDATAAAGWRNVIVCSRPPETAEWADPLREARIAIVYHPRARGNFDAACAARVFRLCRDLSCDVFHCDNNHTSPLIGAALARVPARVWTKHAMEPASEAGRPETWRDRTALSLRVTLALAARVLPVSDAVREELLRKGADERRTSVLLLPLDAETPAPISRATARAALGLPLDAFVVTAIGRASAVKGWDVLVDAFAALTDPRAYLLLVGDASAEPHFRAGLDARIARHGLGDRVRFAGHVSDMGPVFAATDVSVLPSRSEGHALALVEALRAGLPVVASKVGAASDVITHMRNGLLFERESVPQLADLLRALHGDEALVERLGAAARTLQGIPTPREHAEALLTTYRSLLARAHGDAR
jgi:glycosyltransferase involved in cell wall biosynthesis